MTELEQIKMKIAELQEQLLLDAPQLGNLLHTIHKTLTTQGDLVTSLTDDEIATLVSGMKTWNKQVIVPVGAKKAKAKVSDSVAFDFGDVDFSGL